MLDAGLSRSTLVQPGLDCKVVQTGLTLKLAHHKVSTKPFVVIVIIYIGVEIIGRVKLRLTRPIRTNLLTGFEVENKS